MATIEHLPDSLLGAVLAHLGRDRASSALLVSKRWHRMFLSEPALWRELNITPNHLARDLALLRRVGSLAASVTLPQLGPEQLREAMGSAQPGQLQQLTFMAAAWQPAGLPRLSRLTQLDMHLQEPAGLGAALSQLLQLRTFGLTCWTSGMPHEVLLAVLASTQLRELSLLAGYFEQVSALRQLTRLRQLSSLSLTVVNQDAHLQPPEPALLPALKAYFFGATGAYLGPSDTVQIAGCVLRSCRHWECSSEQGSAGGGLAIDELQDGDSMAALLTMLRPGGMSALHELRLSSFAVPPAGVANCSILAAVTHLEACGAAADDWEAALAALLRQAPLLSSLRVAWCFQGGLPQCLVERTGLRRITTTGNGLQALPAGPYLASLERLCLAEDSVVVLPAALTAATALTSLEVKHAIFTDAAPLAADSLAPVLLCLSRLRQLQLTGCGLQELPIEIWPGMSALHSLDLSWNNLSSLPPALSLATSLRQLSLSANTTMALTAQQLGELLSHLPLLEELNLCNCWLTELPEHFPPGLLSLYVSDNRLQRLPVGLGSAALLTSLSVGSNPSLCLTRTEVEALLACLPNLAELDLYATGVPQGVAAYADRILRLRSD